KPMFRSAFKKRRCLVLADGYFEWKAIGKQKQPYFYQVDGGKPFAFGGLWETWHGEGDPLDTCAILTTDANDLAKEVHNPKAVILTAEQAFAWIDPEITDGAALEKMLKPYPPDQMTCVAVDPLVNNVKNNSPKCIEPISL